MTMQSKDCEILSLKGLKFYDNYYSLISEIQQDETEMKSMNNGREEVKKEEENENLLEILKLNFYKEIFSSENVRRQVEIFLNSRYGQ